MAGKSKKEKNIGGWLILIVVIFFLAFCSALYLLIQKLAAISLNIAGWGVYVSSILLLLYLAALFRSIILLLLRKKKALRASRVAIYLGMLFSFWYFLAARLIFYITSLYLVANILDFLLNLALSVIVLAYFRKSNRVKNTLVK